ncbi:MAG: helix-turn-helix transcriptional regulator [Candidatus Korobacteraceae bacterium]
MTREAELDYTSGIHGEIQKTLALPGIVMTESVYQPTSRLGTHVHQNACFGVILDGDYLEGAQRKEFVCGPCTVLFRPPLVEHWSAKGRAGARLLFLEVSDNCLEHIREYSPLPDEPQLFRSGQIARLTASVRRHWNAVGRSAPLAVEGLVYELAAEICQQTPEAKQPAPKWLSRVTEVLHGSFDEPLRLSAIAREVGYHPAYVTRVFQQHYGISIADYVRKLRIDFARLHLVRAEMPLVDVALSAGFPSQAYFSTAFKRETGITPGQYRRSAIRSSGSTSEDARADVFPQERRTAAARLDAE